ncbi:MAG: hypothetical protein KY476_02215 [Planctomycetes bacterium]|nr:hypothetical protein [Planctomycetota bacterium]
MRSPNPLFLSLLIGLLSLTAVAQEPVSADSASEAAEQIKTARANAAIISIQDAESGSEIERVEKPVLRYTEPVRGNVYGTLWVWGRKGRPAAVLELIRHGDPKSDTCQDWFCFHATTDRPIKLTATSGQVWTPQSSDLKFQSLPDAPVPAETPAARIRQMKQFVRRFSAHEFYMRGRVEMRLLPSAVHRYEDRERGLIDGAVFVIAEGTHPEATLFLEAVQPPDEAEPIWQFAIGRSGAAEMVMFYDNKKVHHLPQIETFPPPTNSYWRMMMKCN